MVRIAWILLVATFLLVPHTLLAVEGEEESSESAHLWQIVSDMKECPFNFLGHAEFKKYKVSIVQCHAHLLTVGGRLTKALLGADQPPTRLELVSVRLYYSHGMADRGPSERSFCGTSRTLTETATNETISCSAEPENGGEFNRATRKAGCKRIEASCGDPRDEFPTFVTVKFRLLSGEMGMRHMTLQFDTLELMSATLHHYKADSVLSLILTR